MSDVLPLDDQICFALYATSMAVQRVYKPLLDDFGLTYPQYLVLHVLWEQDGRNVGAIAERLALESSTVTPLVKRLEAAGFVTRRRHPEDDRLVQVHLTDRGAALRNDCGCLAERLLEKSRFALERLVGLNQDIRALRDALR